MQALVTKPATRMEDEERNERNDCMHGEEQHTSTYAMAFTIYSMLSPIQWIHHMLC